MQLSVMVRFALPPLPLPYTHAQHMYMQTHMYKYTMVKGAPLLIWGVTHMGCGCVTASQTRNTAHHKFTSQPIMALQEHCQHVRTHFEKLCVCHCALDFSDLETLQSHHSLISSHKTADVSHVQQPQPTGARLTSVGTM